MGSETHRFGRQQLKLLKEQNKELRNNNQLMNRELSNGLSGVLASAAASQFNITSFNPLFQANIAAPITINFTFLNYFFKTHGIIQTLVMQPVLDALRGGLDLHSDEADEEDLQELCTFLEEEDILNGVVGIGECWARLFGGGAIVVNDGGDFEKPLEEDTPIRFLKLYAASRWELGSPTKLSNPKDVATNSNPWQDAAAKESEFYNYYGQRLHKSRVITMTGIEAPWMVRWQLQGWGMSVVERTIEDFNLFLRTRNVLYDLLNEAKVDVFMIDGMRELLLNAEGDQAMLRRIRTVQQAKNMNNALLLDKNDMYEQKQITFTGIADVMKENRMGIASACRMPISKLFGVAATGFSSGEDDIENYNAVVESEVRAHMRKPLRKVIDLVQRYLWGSTFKYKMAFKPLRVMSAKDEEDIRDKKFNRIIALYDRALMDSEEVGQALHKDSLVSVDTKAQKGLLEEFPEKPMGSEGEQEGDEEKGSKKQPKEDKEK
ncbi:MAG: DUF1073 domain-containing protein [Acidobacteriota bacterium]